jgi:hypothetical protein
MEIRLTWYEHRLENANCMILREYSSDVFQVGRPDIVVVDKIPVYVRLLRSRAIKEL